MRLLERMGFPRRWHITVSIFKIGVENGRLQKYIDLKKWSVLFERYKEIAIVSEKTFKSRVLRGWHPQKAATAPHRNNREITKEVIETAAKNGISENSLRNRVSLYKWPIERAMTEPIHEGHRRKS
jgi:hypothetical protein